MPETPAGYRVAELGALPRVPLEDGAWRPVRHELGITAFGVNGYSADEPGAPLIEEHDETSPGAGGHEDSTSSSRVRRSSRSRGRRSGLLAARCCWSSQR